MFNPVRNFRQKRVESFQSKADEKAEKAQIDKELAKGERTELGIGETYDKYNPDTVISRKGLDYYRKMRLDEQVKAALFIKKFARLSTGYSIIEPENADPKEKESADFVRYALDTINFHKALKGIMTGIDFGYSISEKNWVIADKGQYKGKIVLKNIKDKVPDDYTFVLDAFDNLVSIKDSDGNELPVNKFVVFSYNEEFQNPYGKSDLESTYRAWWQKSVFTKFWTIYMERFGIPTAVGTHPKNATVEQKKTLLQIIKDIQHKTSVIKSDAFAIDLLEVAKEKGELWLHTMDALDSQIARSILCPQLLGVSGTKFGSYALGKKQFDLFIWVLNELGNEIENCVNPQIIRPLVDYNYGDIVRYPSLKFNQIAPEGMESLYQIWVNAVKAGAIVPTDEDKKGFRKVLGLFTPETKEVSSTPEQTH